MMNIPGTECWNITVHKVDTGQYHCWFENDDKIPGEVEKAIEGIEAEFFTEERAADYDIIDNLPIEAEYTHDAIKIGEVRRLPDEPALEFELDLEHGYEQLKEHGYC